jgi:hypothetical protein
MFRKCSIDRVKGRKELSDSVICVHFLTVSRVNLSLYDVLVGMWTIFDQRLLTRKLHKSGLGVL